MYEDFACSKELTPLIVCFKLIDKTVYLKYELIVHLSII